MLGRAQKQIGRRLARLHVVPAMDMRTEQIGEAGLFQLHLQDRRARGRGHGLRSLKRGGEGARPVHRPDVAFQRLHPAALHIGEEAFGQAAPVHGAVIGVEAGLEVGFAAAEIGPDEGVALIDDSQFGHGRELYADDDGFGIHQHAVAVEDHAMGHHSRSLSSPHRPSGRRA